MGMQESDRASMRNYNISLAPIQRQKHQWHADSWCSAQDMMCCHKRLLSLALPHGSLRLRWRLAHVQQPKHTTFVFVLDHLQQQCVCGCVCVWVRA